MPWDVSNFGGLVVAKAHGTIKYEDRLKLLRQIVRDFDSSSADAVLIDYSMSDLHCTNENAEYLGDLINANFARRQPCFIAVLDNNLNRSNLNLIDISVTRATTAKGRICIQSYSEDGAVFNDLVSWREGLNSKFADVVWLD